MEIKEGREINYLEHLGLKAEPDIILCLDAGIAERKVDGKTRWSPTSYRDETANFPEKSTDNSKFDYKIRTTEQGLAMIGSGGGKANILASTELYNHFHKPIIVNSHSVLEAPPNLPQPPEEHWQIYQEALEKKGVLLENILLEKESTSTIEELIKAIEIINAQNRKKMLIVANEMHLPRVKKMYEYLTNPESAKTKLKYILSILSADYKKIMNYTVNGSVENPQITFDNDSFFKQANEVLIDFVAAEDVLSLNNPHYKSLFEKVRQNSYYQKRVEMEKKGIAQLEQGTYAKPK
ncbi:MAG: YdcF family protein [Patescibacteria group bacterium]